MEARYFDDKETFDCGEAQCREGFLAYCIAYYEGGEVDYSLYSVQHCQSSGCHEVYFRNKNGADCVVCGLRACEACQCSRGTSAPDELISGETRKRNATEAELDEALDALVGDGWACEKCIHSAGFELRLNSG